MPSTTPQPVALTIEASDEAAARGEWVEAVAMWERLLESPDRLAATRRIRWFLAENVSGATGARSVSMRRRNRRRLLLASVIGALAGTTCVFLGQEQAGSARIVLSAAAWVLYIATAVLVVAYAFASGHSPEPAKTDVDLDESELHRAREIASRLSSVEGQPNQRN